MIGVIGHGLQKCRMHLKWIRPHLVDTPEEQRFWIRIDRIDAIEKNLDGGSCIYSGGTWFNITETPEQILAALSDNDDINR